MPLHLILRGLFFGLLLFHIAQHECAIDAVAKLIPIVAISQKPGPKFSVRTAAMPINTKTPNDIATRNLYSLTFLGSKIGMVEFRRLQNSNSFCKLKIMAWHRFLYAKSIHPLVHGLALALLYPLIHNRLFDAQQLCHHSRRCSDGFQR